VLIHLTGAAIARGATDVRASSREIAEATGCSRSNVQPAIDALNARGLIVTRQGHATKAAAYLLRFLEVKSITSTGGPAGGPPQHQAVPFGDQQVVPFGDQGGPATTPPPTDSTELAAPPSRLDIEPDRLKELDRVLSSKPADHERDKLQLFAQTIEVYAERLGRRYERRPDA